jgi:hypothetical protein
VTPRRQVLAAASILGAVVLAGCGSSPSSTPEAAAPLAGAASAPGIALASAPMGNLSTPASTIWELFARGRSGWVLLTPPGVATNGGVVGAVVTATSVSTTVVPSANLRFSPVADTSDRGATWSTGILPGGVVASADAVAAATSGRHVALLTSDGGTVVVSQGDLSAWSTMADGARIASATGGSGCGLRTLRAVALGPAGSVLVGGQCAHGARVPVAVWRRGTWHLAGSISAGIDDAVLRLSATSSGIVTILETHWRGSRAVVVARSPNGLGSWTTTPHLVLARGDTVSSTSQGSDGAAIVVVRSAGDTPDAYAIGPSDRGWTALPALPSDVVDVVAAPSGGFQALAVNGATLVVLDASVHGWRAAQRLVIPIASGSSN